MDNLKKDLFYFQNLLRIGGFVTSGRGFIGIDKQRACDFLCCDISTLNRWLKTNKPCKRAVKLLEGRERVLPDEWSQFSFNRTGGLVHSHFRNALTPDLLLSIPHLFNDNSHKDLRIGQYRRLVDELSDSHARKRAQASIKKAMDALERALLDTYLMQDDKFRRNA